MEISVGEPSSAAQLLVVTRLTKPRDLILFEQY